MATKFDVSVIYYYFYTFFSYYDSLCINVKVFYGSLFSKVLIMSSGSWWIIKGFMFLYVSQFGFCDLPNQVCVVRINCSELDVSKCPCSCKC